MNTPKTEVKLPELPKPDPMCMPSGWIRYTEDQMREYGTLCYEAGLSEKATLEARVAALESMLRAAQKESKVAEESLAKVVQQRDELVDVAINTPDVALQDAAEFALAIKRLAHQPNQELAAQKMDHAHHPIQQIDKFNAWLKSDPLRELPDTAHPFPIAFQAGYEAALKTSVADMVNRFLGWKLPKTFCPDAGITFKPDFNENTPWPMKHEPVGTNLFTASEAKAMFEYCLQGSAPNASRKDQS